MNKRNRTIFHLVFIGGIVSIALGFAMNGCSNKAENSVAEKTKAEVLYWTCGMHPSVKISVKEYEKGKKNCPICNMPLIPIYEEKQIETKAVAAGQEATEEYYGCGVTEERHCPHCDLGNPDAKCICGEHSYLIKTGKAINCPVCEKPLKKIANRDLPKGINVGEKPKKPGPRKILYYRNPMHPEITTSVPMKDEMGMDYIPVYESEPEVLTQEEEGVAVSRVRLSKRQTELAGIASETIGKRRLVKTIRAVGKVAFDPELSVAQEEFLTALETRQKVKESSDPDVIGRADDLIEKSKFKLRLLGMGDDEIADLAERGKAQLNLVLPGDRAWIYADVYEYELGWVKVGENVNIMSIAYPGEIFKGVIKSISPVISPMTRSAKVRVEAENPGSKLKPEMYVDVIIENRYIKEDGTEDVLAVPRSAVLDTGTRKIVYVDAGNGAFIGREVEIGPEAVARVDGKEEKLYPVVSGLREGDKVVTKANFLVDSQSQITGVTAASYGGALGAKDQGGQAANQHQH